ncbi:aquaporin-10b [Trichomycterus rosablanca]|uniref:aquaporin-10b n=1 Tax=Trichomycterus rosablanca TaxID=2290929 RepID=UPI002F35F3AB
MDRVLKRCRISSRLVRECLAEFLGVYVLILFGCGSVAQVTTSENTKGEYLSINIGFALGTTFGIYVSKGVSGAHLNPAVSLSLCFLGRFSWTRLPFYVFSQTFGAFLAAATVALQYYDAIFHYSGGYLTVNDAKATAGIFSTYPAEYLSVWGGIVDQVIGTAALLVCVLALGDSRNSPAPPGMEPVLVGAVVLVIGVSMGSNSGYSINPARDLGPRIFTYMAGWGDEVFRAGGGWWWIPLVATSLGGLVGSLIYELLIGVHHPEPELTKIIDNLKDLELDVAQQESERPNGLTKVMNEQAIRYE